MKISRIMGLTVLISTMFIISCSDDDVQVDISPNIDLTFTLQVNEDQIENFAFNEMALFNGAVHSYFGLGESNNVLFDKGVWHSNNGINWLSDTEFADGRVFHTVTEFDDMLFLIGGVNPDTNAELEEIWMSTDGYNWTLASENISFGAISGHTTIAYNDALYLLADNVEDDNGRRMMAVYRSTNGINWTRIATDVFPFRKHTQAVVFNNSIYVVGGVNDADGTFDFYNDIWTTQDGLTWTQVNPIGQTFNPLFNHTLTVYKDALWIIGGITDTNSWSNEIWYSQDGINWIKYNEQVPFDGLNGHNVLVYNDELWLFGGEQEEGFSSAIGSIRLND